MRTSHPNGMAMTKGENGIEDYHTFNEQPTTGEQQDDKKGE